MEQPSAGTSRKRRARYVWRACDVCRRRKGRCDGRKPCDFCRSRSLECRYTSEPDQPNGTTAADQPVAVTATAPATIPITPTLPAGSLGAIG